MKLVATGMICLVVLSIGFCVEASKKEAARELQQLIRFLLFAGQEIDARGSMLEEVFQKAKSITQGATKAFVGQLAEQLKKGGDFQQEWDRAVYEIYNKINWNTKEQELILHCASDFLLSERGIVKEQLFFDAKQLSVMYQERTERLEKECKLCRVLSFSAAAFLIIMIC